MQKKFSQIVAFSLVATTLLTGCGQQQQEEFPYQVINGNELVLGEEPANSVDKAMPTNLTATQLQQLQIVSADGLLDNEAQQKLAVQGDTENELLGAVYDYVSNNIQVDTQNLIPLTDNEQELVIANLDNIISCLKGVENGAMSDDFANYMLWEFSRTQKTWDIATDEYGNPTAYNILGIDPATRKVFVDITFQTTDTNKFTIPVSKIIKGSATEENAKQARLKDYLAYLDARIEYLNVKDNTEQSSGGTYTENVLNIGTGGNTAQLALDRAQARADSLLKSFVTTWGSGGVGSAEAELASILLEQQELDLISRVRHYINTSTTDRMDLDYAEAYKEYLHTESGRPLTDAQILALGERSKYDSWASFSKFLSSKGFSEEQLRSVALGGEYAIARKYLQTPDIGMYTYSGIATQNSLVLTPGTHANMTFRFIFDFDYDLTSTTSVKTSSVYLHSYSLPTTEDITDKKGNFDLSKKFTIEQDKVANIAIIQPYLDRLIYSFQRCIEQENLIGLYKLYGSIDTRDDFTTDIVATTSRFKDWDKYYSDGMRFCYTKFNAYDYKIVGWSNDTIQVEVTRSKKIRGKGTRMTFPSYNERVLIELAVEQDNVYVKSETLIESQLTGEPLSMIRDVTGIADKIAFDSTAFSKASEAGIIQAIQNFSKFQLEYAQQYAATGVEPTIEYSTDKSGAISFDIPKDNLALLKESMISAISTSSGASKAPTEKIVYLRTWNHKSNVYCVVNLRETYMIDGVGKAISFESSITLANRNGVWVVLGYANDNNSVGSLPTTDKGCLCHDYLDPSKPSTTRYNETPEEAERPMGGGTVIDNSTTTPSGGNNGFNNDKPATTTPAQTTTANTSQTTQPVEVEPIVPEEDENPEGTSTEETGSSEITPITPDEGEPAETTASDAQVPASTTATEGGTQTPDSTTATESTTQTPEETPGNIVSPF